MVWSCLACRSFSSYHFCLKINFQILGRCRDFQFVSFGSQGSSNKVQELVGIFTNIRLGVIASNVVPFDSILINVVQNSHACFHASVDFKLSIIGLCHLDAIVELSLVTGVWPRLERPAWRSAVGWGHLHTRSGPEPTIDIDGLEIITVTSFEIAQTAWGPDIGQVIWKFANELLRRWSQKGC